MKKLSIVIALAMSAGTALAADLPSPMKDSYVPSASQAHNWTGVYVGGQLGYSIASHKMDGSYTDTHTKRAYCKTGVLTDGSCYETTVVTPAVPASCAEGTTMHGDVCTKEVSFGNIKKDVVVPDAYSAAKPAVTETKEVPDAYVAAVDTNTVSGVLDGIHGDGLFAGVNAGADIAKGNLLFGVFGNYNFGGADSSASLSFNSVEMASAKIEEGNSWVAGARVGYLFGNDKSSLLYVLGGYSQKDMKYSYVTANDEGSKTLTFSGFVAGAGAEYALNKWASIGIEYQHFFGGKETLLDEGGLKITDDYSDDKVMATLKLKLTGSAFGY